jgi:CRP-like cAMP-binding protein
MLLGDHMRDDVERRASVTAGGIPVPVIDRYLEVGIDTRLPAAAIHVFALFVPHTNAAGDVAISVDPEDVATKLGLARATIYRAYRALHDAGYITWTPSPHGDKRQGGVKGTLRILIPAPQTQL